MLRSSLRAYGVRSTHPQASTSGAPYTPTQRDQKSWRGATDRTEPGYERKDSSYTAIYSFSSCAASAKGPQRQLREVLWSILKREWPSDECCNLCACRVLHDVATVDRPMGSSKISDASENRCYEQRTSRSTPSGGSLLGGCTRGHISRQNAYRESGSR